MPHERFEAAFRDLISPDREGFYSNDPRDIGGETLYGISRKNWPRWAGWARVDAARRLDGFPGSLRTDAELLRLARELYRFAFWDRVRAGEMPAKVGERIFDIAVNAGPGVAGLVLQGALFALDYDIRLDGAIGPNTMAAVSRCAAEMGVDRLWDELQGVHFGFYLGLVTGNPSRHGWAKRGWFRRALEEAETTGIRLEVP